jgi:hypothetical protein
MRAARHAASGVPDGRPAVLRRLGVLALAVLAALVTFALPTPALARPAAASGGPSATTGPASAGGPAAGRRNHRGETDRTSRSLTGGRSASPATTAGPSSVDAKPLGHVVGVGVSHTGPVVVAALPASARATAGDRWSVRSTGQDAALEPAPAGARGSRAPPTA